MQVEKIFYHFFFYRLLLAMGLPGTPEFLFHSHPISWNAVIFN